MNKRQVKSIVKKMLKKRKSKKKSKKRKSRQRIYCGNNALHPDLISGVAIAGSKFRCMKKGYGAGYYGPIDLTVLNDYRPIDDRKIYCGNKDNIPAGYDRHGNAPSCFQKGFYVGKRARALE